MSFGLASVSQAWLLPLKWGSVVTAPGHRYFFLSGCSRSSERCVIGPQPSKPEECHNMGSWGFRTVLASIVRAMEQSWPSREALRQYRSHRSHTDTQRPRVLCFGYRKAGTTSFDQAMRQLGFSHYGYDKDFKKALYKGGLQVAYVMHRDLTASMISRGLIISLLQPIKSVSRIHITF